MNGSGCGLGHPVACTGARMIVTTVYELGAARRRPRRASACAPAAAWARPPCSKSCLLDGAMSWEREVRGIEDRRRRALELGARTPSPGSTQQGRRTIRERIAAVADPGSFREVGPLAGHAETDETGEVVSLPAGELRARDRAPRRAALRRRRRGFHPEGRLALSRGSQEEHLRRGSRAPLSPPLVRFLEGAGGCVRGAAAKRRRGSPSVRRPSLRRAPLRLDRAGARDRPRWSRPRSARWRASRRRDSQRRTSRS